MAYVTPKARARAVRDVHDTLRASRFAVLTTHLNADGDGAGCQAAMASWLRANGTEAWIVNPTRFPDTFRFLLEDEDWAVDVTSSKAGKVCGRADLAVVLDTGEVGRIGRVRPLIRDLPTVVIDHHPTGDNPIGGTSFRDPSASATGEMLYDIIKKAGGPWTPQVLQGIYVAILTDTGGFRFSNATPGAHRVVAEMVEHGVDPEAMHAEVYGRAPIRRYRVMERALATLEVDDEHGVAWMVVPRDVLDETGATAEDLEGMVDIPRGLEGVHVGLLFRLANTGEVKVSFRSNGPVDVNSLARKWDGGGHMRASGAMVPGPVERAVAEVVEATRVAVAGTDFAEVGA